VKSVHPELRRWSRQDLDRMGMVLHEAYLEGAQKARKAYDTLLRWQQLAEVYQESSRRQAAYLCLILRAVGYDVVKMSKKSRSAQKGTLAAPPGYAAKVEEMAEREHGRYSAERLADGWRLGPRDTARKLNPTLVAWSQLLEREREFDRKAVRAFPQALAAAGYTIKPLEQRGTRARAAGRPAARKVVRAGN
jgi:hypothetical protein